MIRVFQFKNNYFSESMYAITAEYNAIGYFDGLDMKKVETGSVEERRIMSDPYYTLVENEGDPLTEKCDYFNILGLSMDDDDNGFWTDRKLPLYFISFVRFQNKVNGLQNLIASMITEVKSETKRVKACLTRQEDGMEDPLCPEAEIIGYYSFDSSDLIICLKTNSYLLGDKSISLYPEYAKKYDANVNLEKSFSVFVMKQAELDSDDAVSRMTDEEVSCLLRCVVRDRGKEKGFREQLANGLSLAAGDIFSYDVLGSDDMILFANNISIKRLVKLYAKDGLLTHSNEYYKDAFFNIATEILVARGKEGSR